MRFNTMYLDIRYPYAVNSRINEKPDFRIGVSLYYINLKKVK